jgi:branched-chain amino acid transport system permease protein
MIGSVTPSLEGPRWNRTLVQGIGIGVLMLVLPFALGSPYHLHLAVLALLYVILTLGLNIVVGLAGLLDLGYIAFYAVGAYLYAILNTEFGWPFWVVLPLGALLASAFGVLLGFPTLRARGDYLALVTLAFGEIIRLLLRNWDALTNGPKGIAGVKSPAVFSFALQQPLHFYYLILFLALFFVFLFWGVRDSWMGRNLRAIRDDEVAAESIGVNALLWKLVAFALAAGVAGVAGVFFAAWQSFVAPESFTLMESVIILCMVVMGGMGRLWGPILAAVTLVLLPEVLRDFREFRMLLFGLALIVIVIAQERKGQNKPRRATQKESAPEINRINDESSTERPTWDAKRSSDSAVILKVRNLSKAFAGVQALAKVSFDVLEGEILGLIGPNGAGKSTLVGCIMMTQRPDSGSVDLRKPFPAQGLSTHASEAVCWHSVIRLKSHQISGLGLARTFQSVRLFYTMTVIENVVVAAQKLDRCGQLRSIMTHLQAILRTPSSRRSEEQCAILAMEKLRLLGIEELARMPSDILPLAHQRLVEIARAMATKPSLLLLDEPAAGLSAEEKSAFKRVLRHIRKNLGVSIILVEHDMGVVMDLCDRIIVLDRGEKIAEGTPEIIRKNELVINAYLGVT